MGKRATVLAAALGLAAIACGDDDTAQPTGTAATGTGGSGGTGQGGSGGGGDLDIGVCAPDNGPFETEGDNPYLPFPVGLVLTFQGEEDGATLDLRITVLDETEDVAGVTTRVVEEREEEDAELVEVSRNFFVQAPDGTVCYYGEDVDIYEGGEIVSHEGEWRAGEGENLPGILMPASPAVGQTYQQEVAPGIAMDRAEIVAIGEPFTVPAGSYDDTLATEESSPLDSGLSFKRYASGVGLIVDEPVELVSVTGN